MSGFEGEGSSADFGDPGGASEGPEPSDAQAPGQSAPGEDGMPGTQSAPAPAGTSVSLIEVAVTDMLDKVEAAIAGLGLGGASPSPSSPAALSPLEPVELTQSRAVAKVSLDQVTNVNAGQLFNNVISGVLSVLGIATGTPMGIATGVQRGVAVINAPSAFSTSLQETISFPGSDAPSINPSGANGPSQAGAAFSGQEGDVSGSAVLGYDGSQVNVPKELSLVSALPGGSVPLGFMSPAQRAMYRTGSSPRGSAAQPPTTGVPIALAVAIGSYLLFGG